MRVNLESRACEGLECRERQGLECQQCEGLECQAEQPQHDDPKHRALEVE